MQLELRRIVTSLQIKKCKTHLLFVFDLIIYRKMRLCVTIKKKHSLLRLLGGLRAMNGLEIVKYYFQAFSPYLKQLVNGHVTVFIYFIKIRELSL